MPRGGGETRGINILWIGEGNRKEESVTERKKKCNGKDECNGKGSRVEGIEGSGRKCNGRKCKEWKRM